MVSAIKELGRIIEWQQTQMNALEVAVHLNSEITAERVAEIDPDVIIMATGSHPHRVPIVGKEAHAKALRSKGASTYP